MELRIVLVTCPELQNAEEIALSLVRDKVAACVNILPQGKSIYSWQGKIESQSEVLLLIKSTAAKLPELESKLLAIHPYSTPEFIVLTPSGVNEKYLDWALKTLSPQNKS